MDADKRILEGLNKEQIESVTAINGPVLILAGAGSGKTKALTHRIAYMIAKGIEPENILAVTFTNKAAGEMRDRAVDLINKFVSVKTPPLIGTFHSVCVRLLRREIGKIGYDNSFVIYDYNDQTSLIKKIMDDLQISTKRYSPGMVLSKISNLKSELVDTKEFGARANGFMDRMIAGLYDAYQTGLRSANAVDFDDLIMLTVRLFKSNPEVLEKYQNQYQYILIDEYQDTNHAQYVWTSLLASKNRQIAVVGDDAQSIYGWRQADIRNILNFEKDYPEAKVIKLEQNYRSTQNILDGANSIIANNSSQKPKNLWTDNKKGEPIIIKEAANEKEEAAYVANTIRTIGSKNKKLNNIAILYRTHAQSRSLEESLIRHGIPYRIYGGIKFYERKEIKDILAYLRLSRNTRDSVSFARIANVPGRGIGNTTLAQVSLNNEVNGESGAAKLRLSGLEGLNKRQATAINGFVELIGTFAAMASSEPVTSIVKAIIDKTGYKKYLLDGTLEGETRWENVQELLTAAQKLDEYAAQKEWIDFWMKYH